MALERAQGVLTIPAGTAVGTTFPVALSFRPKAIFVFTAFRTTADEIIQGINQSYGWAVEHAGGAIAQAVLSWRAIDDDGSGDYSTTRVSSNVCVDRQADANGKVAEGWVSAIDATGFTYQTTAVAPATTNRVHWVALGGADLQAELVQVPTLNAGGTQALALTQGFEPNAVLFYGGPRNVGLATQAADTAPVLGLAVKVGGTITQRGLGQTGGGAGGVVGGYQHRSTTALAPYPLWGTTGAAGLHYAIALDAVTATQLTVNRTTGSAENTPAFFVCLRAPGVDLQQYQASTAGAATHASGPLDHQPVALVAMYAGSAGGADTTVWGGAHALGAASLGAGGAVTQATIAAQDTGFTSSTSDTGNAEDTDSLAFRLRRPSLSTFSKNEEFQVTSMGSGATPSGYSITQTLASTTAATLFVLSLGTATGGGGGTTTPKSVAGSVTPSGTVARLVIPASGALTKALAGGSTPTGAITEIGIGVAAIEGALTPSGTLAVERVGLARQAAGGVTPSGTVTREVRKRLTAAVAPSGTLTRRTTVTTPKALAGASTPSGALAMLRQAAGGGRGRDRRRRGVAAILTAGRW